MELQKKIFWSLMEREYTEKCTNGADMQAFTPKKRKKSKRKKKSCRAEEMHSTDKERDYTPHLSKECEETPSSDDIGEAFDLMPKPPLLIKYQHRNKGRNIHTKDACIAASELNSFRMKGNEALDKNKLTPKQTKILHKRRRKERAKEVNVSQEMRKKEKNNVSISKTVPASCVTAKVQEKVSSKSISEASQLCPERKKKKYLKKSEADDDIFDERRDVKVEIRNLSSNDTSSELSIRLHVTSSESECSASTQKDHNDGGIQNLPEERNVYGFSHKAHMKKSVHDINNSLQLGRNDSMMSLPTHQKNTPQNSKPKFHPCENNSMSLNTSQSFEFKNDSELTLTENARRRGSSHDGSDEESSYHCSQCDNKFDFVRDLLSHECGSNDRCDDESVYFCTPCDSNFVNLKDLMAHECVTLRSIAPRPSGKERTMGCILCGRKFVHNHHLNLHYKTIHKRKKDYKCEVCDQVFSVKQTLVVHMRRHSREKPYECEVCDYKCITSTNLNRHYIRKHGMVQSHECRVCSYKFFSERDLNIHLQLRHKSSTMQVLQSLV